MASVLTPTYRCSRMYGPRPVPYFASSARDGMTRYCATSPLRQGQCDAGSIGQITQRPRGLPRSPDNAMRMPQRTDDGFLAYSFVECTHRCGYVAIKKKLDNRNEPVTWLHLCYRLANDSNAGINVSGIRAHKVETDVGIIHFVNVEHAARHERDALGTAGFQYIQRAHAVR